MNYFIHFASSYWNFFQYPSYGKIQPCVARKNRVSWNSFKWLLAYMNNIFSLFNRPRRLMLSPSLRDGKIWPIHEMTHLKVFHSCSAVTIFNEKLQILGFCVVPFELEGIFIVLHLLWHGNSVFAVSSKGLPLLIPKVRGVSHSHSLGNILCLWIIINFTSSYWYFIQYPSYGKFQPCVARKNTVSWNLFDWLHACMNNF